jgi:hypothetical protein
LLQGFYGIKFARTHPNGHSLLSGPLLHSTHNTGNKVTKVSLVCRAHYTKALHKTSHLPEEFIKAFEIPCTEVTMQKPAEQCELIHTLMESVSQLYEQLEASKI